MVDWVLPWDALGLADSKLVFTGFFVPFPSHLCLFGFKIKLIKLESLREMFFNLFFVIHAYSID